LPRDKAMANGRNQEQYGDPGFNTRSPQRSRKAGGSISVVRLAIVHCGFDCEIRGLR
jgi:hypothetical protein